jgi:hypothetical protein
MLGRIACVTVTSADLEVSESLYSSALAYRTVAGGLIDAALARSWNAPGTEGARWLAMAPEGADDFCMRFVEQPGTAAYQPLRCHGWNAAEIVVADVDSLAPAVVAAGFELIGPPEDLSFSDQIRAMQVMGPDGEVLYLTMIKGPVPGLVLPTARCTVDRTFIAVLGGPDIDASKSFYSANFDVPPADTIDSRVSVLANAFGLDREYRFRIAALEIGGESFIETDQMPDAAIPRPIADGMLPPAIAMVSFRNDTAELKDGTPIDGPPYYGARHTCLKGPAGEIIELIGG